MGSIRIEGNVLAVEGGAHWLGAYGAVATTGATAAALAVG
jgi:hypothetical protein